MRNLKVAIVVGSNRAQSINRKLAVGLSGLLPANTEISFPQIDDLPMYNMDLETDRPAVVNRFTSEIAAVDGVIFVMPEHNRSVPAVLKNAIDWGSKPMDKNVWRNKTSFITGTSPGAMGTALGQQHLRQILNILGTHALSGEAYIQFKPELFDDQGALVGDTKNFLQGHIDRFVSLTQKLAD